jgi:hypothetical protein
LERKPNNPGDLSILHVRGFVISKIWKKVYNILIFKLEGFAALNGGFERV